MAVSYGEEFDRSVVRVLWMWNAWWSDWTMLVHGYSVEKLEWVEDDVRYRNGEAETITVILPGGQIPDYVPAE